MKEDYAVAITRGLLTIALSVMCGTLMILTNGKHGIGWFIFGLIIIW